MKLLTQTFCYFIFLMLTNSAYTDNEEETVQLEKSVCGFKEPFYFWLWSSAAGQPRRSEQVVSEYIKDISFLTLDGRILRGYQYRANLNDAETTRNAKGFLLVLQGNAILADQLIYEFSSYSQAGYDVYVFDYRGYGRSEGKRRLKAIVNDIGEMINYLSKQPYQDNIIYAMSFGGIVLLDAKYNTDIVKRIVIDSTPSRLSTYGCPTSYDPLENLPDDCRKYLFITGQRDSVVKPKMSMDLVEEAKKCGASHSTNDEFSHPFMDRSFRIHQQRMQIIANHLLNNEG